MIKAKKKIIFLQEQRKIFLYATVQNKPNYLLSLVILQELRLVVKIIGPKINTKFFGTEDIVQGCSRFCSQIPVGGMLIYSSPCGAG